MMLNFTRSGIKNFDDETIVRWSALDVYGDTHAVYILTNTNDNDVFVSVNDGEWELVTTDEVIEMIDYIAFGETA